MKTTTLSFVTTEGDTATVYGKLKISRRQTVTFSLMLQDLPNRAQGWRPSG